MKAIWAIASVMMRELVRKKDFYILLIFLLALLGFLSSQSFFNVEGISRYIKDFGYSLVTLFSFIIAVTFTAKQMPGELESKTIYPLLAKPVSRHTIILGKFLGGVVISSISFVLFYGIFCIFQWIGGTGNSFMLLGQGFLFGILFLCLVCAIAMFLSNIMTLGANITLSVLLYIMISGFADSVRDSVLFSKGITSVLGGIFYYLIPHFEFYDLRIRITHSWDPLPGWIVVAVALYTCIYCFVLIYFAGLIFRRKRL
ncbi:MAG: ABC transporter permease subunit [Candidatus Omnitrophica bacterium]|nr:ABC transporter permease subunit [Candidatus Omnitrophota bacterium]